jgi:hypothetical protein
VCICWIDVLSLSNIKTEYVADVLILALTAFMQATVKKPVNLLLQFIVIVPLLATFVGPLPFSSALAFTVTALVTPLGALEDPTHRLPLVSMRARSVLPLVPNIRAPTAL